MFQIAGLLVTSAIFTVVALHLLAAGLTALAAMPLFRGVLSLREALGTVFCLALIGLVTGFLVGLSQTPVVAAIVPAVLSLLSGLVLIAVGREGETGTRLLIAVAAAALVLNLLLGSLWGARVREAPDAVGSPTRNAEMLREWVCDQRFSYELELRKKRQAQHLPDPNPNLLVPGCSPPFGSVSYLPAGS